MTLGTPATHRLAIAALLFNAFTWGVSWWPFRQLQALGVHPLWQTTLVFAAAVAVLVAVWPRAVVELARRRSTGKNSPPCCPTEPNLPARCAV